MKRKTVERQIKQWVKNGTLHEKLSHYVENSIQDIHEGYSTSRLFTIPLCFYNISNRMDCSESFYNDKFLWDILTYEYGVYVGRPYYPNKSIYYDEILEALCNRIIEVESEWDF